MTESGTGQRVLSAIHEAELLYERLVLVVGPAGSGKTATLLGAAERAGYAYVNVNLAYSQILLDVPLVDRAHRAPRLLDQILDDSHAPVLLDNMEILFDSSLALQPLHWLRRTSRNRTVVAAWNGAVDQGHITYAEPGHPEYRREPIDGIVLVTTAT